MQPEGSKGEYPHQEMDRAEEARVQPDLDELRADADFSHGGQDLHSTPAVQRVTSEF